ncbi:uncharacterized protein LOC110008215 isoform X2 [Amborella trichopoda]|uniref:uncharacterized protein LOC110008215 isoform X2 n=1 Tax=Amborella trichopoda TaxID=13333 RepID=UPI0009BF22FC|nr:uncharacterized protein LOC110008215 isoform X2 [Amborella trichopoda]|eukprot:XP_020529901.1 uncharacterized protein LOC110008215 isoform X2 [Amborella trichopoda]
MGHCIMKYSLGSMDGQDKINGQAPGTEKSTIESCLSLSEYMKSYFEFIAIPIPDDALNAPLASEIMSPLSTDAMLDTRLKGQASGEPLEGGNWVGSTCRLDGMIDMGLGLDPNIGHPMTSKYWTPDDLYPTRAGSGLRSFFEPDRVGSRSRLTQLVENKKKNEGREDLKRGRILEIKRVTLGSNITHVPCLLMHNRNMFLEYISLPVLALFGIFGRLQRNEGNSWTLALKANVRLRSVGWKEMKALSWSCWP